MSAPTYADFPNNKAKHQSHVFSRRFIIHIIIGISYKTLVIRIVKRCKVHFRIDFQRIYYVSIVTQRCISFLTMQK